MAAAILPVAKIAGGLLFGKALSKGVSSLIGGKKKAPEPAMPEEPQVMPLPDDEAVQRERRKSIARQRQRAGRSSTILTGDSETLGGG